MIKNTVIDSLPVVFIKITEPGYLDRLRLQLEEKNIDIISSSDCKAEFYIDNVPSSMNFNKLKDQ